MPNGIYSGGKIAGNKNRKKAIEIQDLSKRTFGYIVSHFHVYKLIEITCISTDFLRILPINSA